MRITAVRELCAVTAFAFLGIYVFVTEHDSHATGQEHISGWTTQTQEVPATDASTEQHSSVADAANFSSHGSNAKLFGVYEVVLTGSEDSSNPFDVMATVEFIPPSGEKNSRKVHAFYDGGKTWRARVYASETGTWKWRSVCETDGGLDGKQGTFETIASKMPGRLVLHPANSRQWSTENGRWFLNLSDTAYFVLCAQDGNGVSVSDEQVTRYVQDDVDRGITSLRCFLASRPEGFSESSDQWTAWHWESISKDRLRLDAMQSADRRLQLLLREFPEVAVQLILFPLEGYARDDRFWISLSSIQRERLLRNLVARFGAYPQLFWLIANDAHYGVKFPNNNAMVREVGAYFKKHDVWQHPLSTGHARRVPFYFGEEDWATYIHIEHEHDLAAAEYLKYHVHSKPVFLGEDRYEQDHGEKRDPIHMQYWQRRLFWSWLFAGGSTNYGGRWWCVQPYSSTGVLTAAYHQRPSVVFEKQLIGLDCVRPIRDFFEKRDIDLANFTPDHSVILDAGDPNKTQALRVMRRQQKEFLAYHPNAASDGQTCDVRHAQQARFRINLTEGLGQFTVEWYRASDGLSQMGDTISGGAWREFTAPWSGADVIVRILQARPESDRSD